MRAKKDHTLDGVLELTNVAGPIEAAEHVHRVGLDAAQQVFQSAEPALVFRIHLALLGDAARRLDRADDRTVHVRAGVHPGPVPGKPAVGDVDACDPAVPAVLSEGIDRAAKPRVVNRCVHRGSRADELHAADDAALSGAHAGGPARVVDAAVGALHDGVPAVRAALFDDGSSSAVGACSAKRCGVPGREIIAVAPLAGEHGRREIEMLVTGRLGFPLHQAGANRCSGEGDFLARDERRRRTGNGFERGV